MITIVDYKLNNLRSLENTLRRLGHDVRVTSEPDEVRAASKLILPGVGAFGDGIRNLKQLGLAEPFIENVNSGTPALGICLGMHLLFTESEEFGYHRGLDLLQGRIVKLPPNLRVPHMGWNQLHPNGANGLTNGIAESSFVYFVHSYYAEPASADIVLATTDYEIEFPAIVHYKNIWATQFHPEKSQHVGERLLDNFARL
ncbi:MAG: imidazole glycerol phosphate synthase subunit HisH [Acidobacteria bacterium]|nr:MAG: imidazole glycerol phosphate synthase subunit HisH [Acidobacteriota bacterium]